MPGCSVIHVNRNELGDFSKIDQGQDLRRLCHRLIARLLDHFGL